MSIEGIPYFPMESTEDDSFNFVRAEHGIAGYGTLILLMRKIYGGKGYYTEWSERHAKLFAMNFNLEYKLVRSVVNTAVDEGIFDRAMLERYGILTSEIIQKNYARVARKRKMPFKISEYLTIDLADIELQCEESSVQNDFSSVQNEESSVQNDDSSVHFSTSKAKESKAKESKAKESKAKESRAEESRAPHKRGTCVQAAPAQASPAPAAENDFAFGEKSGYEQALQATVDEAVERSLAVNGNTADENSLSDDTHEKHSTAARERFSEDYADEGVQLPEKAGSRTAETSGKKDTDDEKRRALVEEYGEENVAEYERKFRVWSAGKRHLKLKGLDMVRKWLEEDGVRGDAVSELNGAGEEGYHSFTVEDVLAQIIEKQYRS